MLVGLRPASGLMTNGEAVVKLATDIMSSLKVMFKKKFFLKIAPMLREIV